MQFTILREPIVTAIGASPRSKNGVTATFTHAIGADHVWYCASGYNVIEIYEDWQEIYARIDVSTNYSWEKICTEIIPRHLRDTMPLRILFLYFRSKGASVRGINHADGDNGKSFVQGVRCPGKRSHWLNVPTGEKLLICRRREDERRKCEHQRCKSLKKIILTIGMQIYW